MFVLDPILASGNTAIAALQILVAWGVKASNIVLVSVLASQHAVDLLEKQFPEVQVRQTGTVVLCDI